MVPPWLYSPLSLLLVRLPSNPLVLTVLVALAELGGGVSLDIGVWLRRGLAENVCNILASFNLSAKLGSFIVVFKPGSGEHPFDGNFTSFEELLECTSLLMANEPVVVAIRLLTLPVLVSIPMMLLELLLDDRAPAADLFEACFPAAEPVDLSE